MYNNYGKDCLISGGSRGRSQGATDPPFQSSYCGFTTATTASYLSVFVAILYFDSMIVPVVLMYQLPKECSG